jgi:hypothetical protein
MTMTASAATNVHTLHIARCCESEVGFGSNQNTSPVPFVPMVKLEQASDHYRVSIVMPPVECKNNWVGWDQGKLRLTVPAVNYRNSPITRPGFIRWVSLPEDASRKELPQIMYAQGSIRILVLRKSGWG